MKYMSLLKKSKKGMALLLVMTVIVVVLGTVTIGATLLLNNLDQAKGREDASQALVSAQAGIEKAKGYYKNDEKFFDGCVVNDCIDFVNNRCTTCSDSNATYNNEKRRYQVKIININDKGVALSATGYQGPYNRSVRDAVIFTPFICGDGAKGLVTDRDGFVYLTVEIGSQCWLAENLKTKTMRNGACINYANSEFIAPDCVFNNHGIEYGGDKNTGRDCVQTKDEIIRGLEADCEANYTLYRWYSAMNEDEGTDQGICPDGWHIPTLTDTENLFSELGGEKYAGRELMVDGSSGFNAILTGDRQLDGDTFTSRDEWDCFWTTNFDKDSASYICVQFKNDEAYTFTDSKDYSIAVRCIKD